MTEEFVAFPKIARLTRGCVITEKLDGTNAQIHIMDDGSFLVGSRNRYITPNADNYGFAKWVNENITELMKLGPGRHFGEWWGLGIQRGYNQTEKRFSLFNTKRWEDVDLPACVSLVPVLYEGDFSSTAVDWAIEELRKNGSHAAPGYPFPEGVIVYHAASRTLFKKTLEKDEEPKGRG